MIEIGHRYRHYKGNEYRVLHVARSSENPEEQFAIYQDVRAPEKIWARPLGMFMEGVEVSGAKVPRFAYIGE